MSSAIAATTRSTRPPNGGPARSIAELTRRAMSSDPPESTVAFALERLRVDLGADAASFWDMPEPGRLRLAAADGWPGAVDGAILPIAPDSQAAFVLASDEVVVADLGTDRRFVPSSMLRSQGFAVTVGCRVGNATAPKGIVTVAHRSRRAVADGELEYTAAMVGVVALALDYDRSRADLRYRAEHDALTGLMNRASLLEALDQAVDTQSAAAVLLIDLDGFKVVNDAGGHAAGDEVLQVVARRLQDVVRSGDLVGRLGGDEFVVIARRCDTSAARTLAERIVGGIEQLITIGERTVSISASVGITETGAHRGGREALRDADAAMYEAKASGRGRVHIVAQPVVATSEPPARQARSTNRCEDEPVTLAMIERAIEQVGVAFQPLVATAGHELVGLEALARGPVGTRFEQPAAFFAAAETFSRLRELDLAAKRAAFASGVPDDVSLFLNVDPAVLTDDWFRGRLIDAWQSSGFAGDVVIELTERSLVAAPGRLLRAIAHCREAGWRIALDDLGARAETLTALRLVRPDIAKLDMSLVDPHNRSHAASVAVAVNSHRDRWPLTVVAEGVETAEHERVARDLGADLLQGFRFGRPGPLDRVLAGTVVRRRSSRRGSDGADVGDAVDGPPVDGRWVATKRHLIEITRVVEAMAGGPESIVLGALQSIDHYSDRTRRQYAALARRCGMTGVLGRGVPPGVVVGVHHAPIPVGDPLLRSWNVVVLSADGGIALLAEEADTRSDVPDLDRVFRYRVTRDPVTVEAAAHRLLAYF